VQLVLEARGDELVRMIEEGCVEVIARGMELDDSGIRAGSFRALESLL
jgi:hypothetical protein